MKNIFARTCLLFWIGSAAVADGRKNITLITEGERILDEILAEHPNIKRHRPIEYDDEGHSVPLVVLVNMYLRALSHVSEANMEYQLQLTYREKWTDHRLAWGDGLEKVSNETYVILEDPNSIWRPDTFFMNEKQASNHAIMKPNVLIRVLPDGRVLQSVRLTMTLATPMDLHYYPMDVQTFLIKLGSYAFTDQEILYQWDKEQVTYKPELLKSLPQFNLADILVENIETGTSTGQYSGLCAKLLLTREFGYYLLHLYIPGAALVIVSWVSFWLDPTSVPGRVTLGVTVLLTSHALASGVSSVLPPVSYIKSIDVWILTCACFIFASLIEFAFVTYLYTGQLAIANRKKPNQERQRLLSNTSTHSTSFIEGGTPTEEPKMPKIPFLNHVNAQLQKDARIVDRYARILFPLLFLLFNLFYWTKYSNQQFS